MRNKQEKTDFHSGAEHFAPATVTVSWIRIHPIELTILYK
jgi:hypothetical protein